MPDLPDLTRRKSRHTYLSRVCGSKRGEGLDKMRGVFEALFFEMSVRPWRPSWICLGHLRRHCRRNGMDATSAAIEQLRLKAAAGKSKHAVSRCLFLNNDASPSHFTRRDLEMACRRRRVGRSLNSNSNRNAAQLSRSSVAGGALSPVYNAKLKTGVNNTKNKPRFSKAATSPGNVATAAAAGTTNINAEGQVRSLDNGVKLCARKYNDCKAEADRLAMELQKRIDEQATLEKEAVALEDMVEGNNPEAQRIASLKDEINRANASADEKLHYRLQLNHMLQRCRKNSVSLDKHLGAMSDTLDAARKEREQCERMLGEVEAGFSDAVRSLESTARTLEIERGERNRTLAEKRSDAKNSSMLEAWRNDRESSRQDLENSLGGNLRQEKEDLKVQMRQRQRDMKLLNKEIGTKVSDAGALEETANKIKQVTGLNGLEEVIEKLQHAKNHHEKLLLERSNAEERLRAARHMLQNVNASNEHNTARGYGDTELNRYLQDELSQSISNEQTQGKVVRSTNVRLEAVLVGLRQGSMGLYQKLLPFHPTLLDCDPPRLSDTTSSSPIQAAYETLDILKMSSLILGKMLDAVGGIDRVIETEASIKKNGAAASNIATSGNGERAACENDIIENNCRIEVCGGEGVECHDERDGDTSIGLQRCPSRGTMKAMSESEVGGATASRKKKQLSRPPRDREDPLRRVDDVCRDPELE